MEDVPMLQDSRPSTMASNLPTLLTAGPRLTRNGRWSPLYSFDMDRTENAELSLSYGWRSVDQFILVSGSPLRTMTRFYPYPIFSGNCFVVLPAWHPLWREDGSVTYSAIAYWPGHWGPITIHCRFIWECVPSSSPLTTRRDCGGGILTCLHTGSTENAASNSSVVGWRPCSRGPHRKYRSSVSCEIVITLMSLLFRNLVMAL
jgi:hypothetical protein